MNTQRLAVDLGKYPPGLGVGHEKVTVVCPKCGLGAYVRRFKASTQYIHRGLLENGTDGLKWTVHTKCVVRERNELE